MLAFTKLERFIALAPIIPFQPALGKDVPSGFNSICGLASELIFGTIARWELWPQAEYYSRVEYFVARSVKTLQLQFLKCFQVRDVRLFYAAEKRRAGPAEISRSDHEQTCR